VTLYKKKNASKDKGRNQGKGQGKEKGAGPQRCGNKTVQQMASPSARNDGPPLPVKKRSDVETKKKSRGGVINERTEGRTEKKTRRNAEKGRPEGLEAEEGDVRLNTVLSGLGVSKLKGMRQVREGKRQRNRARNEKGKNSRSALSHISIGDRKKEENPHTE